MTRVLVKSVLKIAIVVQVNYRNGVHLQFVIEFLPTDWVLQGLCTNLLKTTNLLKINEVFLFFFLLKRRMPSTCSFPYIPDTYKKTNEKLKNTYK